MKKKFDPNQQRNPSGSPEGGQWVSESETAQKWGSLRANAQEWVDKLKAQNNRYTSFANDAIYDARKGLLLHAKNATDPEEKAKWQLRLDESKAELARRADMGKYTRRLAAIDEGIRTGKLTIHRDEMAEILANQGDVYRDHGFSGDHEYDPELFVTSDLSGRPIRHYVTLPDGRIAHPDELHGSQYKGRIVVIDKFDGAGDLAKHMGANRSRRAKRAARHEAMKRQPVDVAMGKGGGGSGNFGHKGRPGLVGGSTRLQDEPNWKLQSQSYKPTMRYAKKYFGQFRAPTEEEAANFQKMMENIHPDLQKLWIGWSSENPKPLETMLLVSDEYAGEASGIQVFLGKEFLKSGDDHTARHEYLHTLLNQESLSSRIYRDYKPPWSYAHARDVGTMNGTKLDLNEQLNMSLTYYHPDRNVWAADLEKGLSTDYYFNPGRSKEQIAEIDRLFKGMGLW